MYLIRVWISLFIAMMVAHASADPADPSAYCSSKGNTVDEYIGLFQLGNFSNSSTDLADYTDFSQHIIPVSQGETLSVSMAQGNGSWNEFWSIWIDFNHDFDFSEDESFFIGSSTSSIQGDIQIPNTALLGTTLMRVTMKYASQAEPCEHFGYGEVEDYSIDIRAGNSEDSPTAHGQTVNLELGLRLPIRLTGDTPASHSQVFEIVSEPAHGQLLGELPEVIYVPHDPANVSEDSFSFKVSDGITWSTPAIVTIHKRDQQISSQDVGGPTLGIGLHLPNHLALKDIGPSAFPVSMVRSDDPLDQAIRRTQMNGKQLAVQLEQHTFNPPYTLALKWIPDQAQSNGTIFNSDSLQLFEVNGTVHTSMNNGVSSAHPLSVKTTSCNQATIVVNDTSMTTYINGESNTQSITSQALGGTLRMGQYPGQIWDLRVYDRALNSNEIVDAAQDCTHTTATPFDGYPLYRCGVYICIWYRAEDNLSEGDLTYLPDQDWFYEHNLFNVGMHPHGDIGGYFKGGRPGYHAGAKWRDMVLDNRWIQYARLRDRFNNSYWVHEDFHQYQGVLGDYIGKGWNYFMAEATAEWAPVEYTPEVQGMYILGEYIFDAHLPLWMTGGSDQSNYTTIRIDGTPQGGHPYGSYVFFSYVTREILSSKTIGDIYNHPDDPQRPIEALYKIMGQSGVDMRDAFIEFASRTVTYDYQHGLTQAFRDNEANSLSSIQNHINPNITADSKYTTVYDSQGSGSQWKSLPAGKRPGSWAYNLFKIENAIGEYKFAVLPDANNPAHSEFRATVLRYDESSETRAYYDLPFQSLEEGITVSASGEDLILVVATTPAQRFSGVEQYHYQYKMEKVQPAESAIPIYLLAGQSNMEGHIENGLWTDLLNELNSGPLNTLQSRLEFQLNDWYLNYDGGYANYAYSEAVATYQAGEMVRMFEEGLIGDQLLNARDDVWCAFNQAPVSALQPNCGYSFGPELTTGHYLGNILDDQTALIKIAKGGSTLHTDWLSPTSSNAQNKPIGPQYTELKNRIQDLNNNASSILPACENQACQWAAFIWFQGENDSFSASGSAAYEENLVNLINDVRAEVGNPNLPVIIVGIGHWAKSMTYGSIVHQAQLNASSAVNNTTFIQTDDLSRYYHYDPASHLILGERLGKALQLISP